MTTYALLHTIFFFFVYAFLGWCVEVAYAAITTRELVNRGFLNGPICPIYGCGMTVMIAVLGRFTMPSSDMAWYQNVLVAFFGGMVITTLVELVGGYILYKMFHTRWWDYSMYRFNLGGFICPQFSLLWGLGSVLLMVVVHPLLSKPSAAIPTLVLIWLDVIFGGLFLADLIVSAIQAVGFSKQLARIDELRKAMRTTSDALTEVIGTSAMTMDTLLDEQKLQLTLAAMEGATNAAELLFFTDRQQVYKARASEFGETKASALGDYLPAKLGMDTGENVIWLCLPGDYSGYMIFFFENGKAAKVELSAYKTTSNRRRLTGAYSDKSPLKALLHLKEDREIAVYSTEPRVLIVNTALLGVKTTRTTQGVALLTLKKKYVLDTVRFPEETGITDLARYRGRSIPATGALLKTEDSDDKQLSLI